MKPFDLKLACEGAPLCTRDGRDVTEFYYFKTCTQEGSCRAIIEGLMHHYNVNGRYSDSSKGSEASRDDLFLKSEKKKLWIMVRKEPENGAHYTTHAFDKP